ncbi:hypothetical protein BDQ17DRAFT_170633 [Cyathus striatus]|nr:hypothetical protein BDQ17DRAFT_170633 [Cyathus striatus]
MFCFIFLDWLLLPLIRRPLSTRTASVCYGIRMPVFCRLHMVILCFNWRRCAWNSEMMSNGVFDISVSSCQR